jgi:Protein of unknown function (DUF2857)
MDKHNTDIYRKIASCLFDKMYDFVKIDSNCKIDAKLLLELSEMDIRGRNFIESNAIHYLSFHIDTESLSNVLKKWHSTRKNIELEDQFLLLQAPQKLMRELFGMHATTFSWRRRLLGLQGEGRHRPFDCNQTIEMEIWSLWHKYNNLTERDRYLKVADLTNYSISVITAAVRRFNEASIDRK